MNFCVFISGLKIEFFPDTFYVKEKVTKENVLNGFSTPSNFFLSADALRDILLSLFILGALITRSAIIVSNYSRNLKRFVSKNLRM